ncbi:MAG: hypothetical protein GTN62_09365 [Gemmatimonadales bacterium]|nr:hypothetical protein [Gemmatimonadales bacterium]NIN11698.1 hypothetical protein [Gemmatimonadales bacterium]NIN50304.1 hypothetical protein [Gemmatimonadales bacterium]NIP07768.1 hypothetical protein [Gemmatimonadales bacterium]NIQ99171.1 hypothetical protein [Gemmatimonadales bacterium]
MKSPLNRNGTYTQRDWTRDHHATVAGANPEPCPKCGRMGFYGPRARSGDQYYRACRFCGFWQEVGGEPQYFEPTVHGCGSWPSVAGAPYIWWVHRDATAYVCPYCERDVDVKSHEARNPYLHRDHPWWKVPQRKSYRRYMKFWAQWSAAAGRPYL